MNPLRDAIQILASANPQELPALSLDERRRFEGQLAQWIRLCRDLPLPSRAPRSGVLLDLVDTKGRQ